MAVVWRWCEYEEKREERRESVKREEEERNGEGRRGLYLSSEL